jgi:hypothetical protein
MEGPGLQCGGYFGKNWHPLGDKDGDLKEDGGKEMKSMHGRKI